AFTGSRVIITGGGTGIGRQMAEGIAKLGGEVAICGRREAPLAETAKAIESAGGRCIFATCDIREVQEIQDFVTHAKAELGGCEVLFNNAGGQFPTTAEGLSPNGWQAVIRNNLNGTFYMTQAVAKEMMMPAKSGRIVNIIANIERGFPGMVHTGAARAGVENMTKTLAVEWAHYGITTVALAPGVVVSTGTKQYPPELLEMTRKATPAKRWASQTEVANIALFLALPTASFITGCTVKADGGASIWGESWFIPDHNPLSGEE
ncbi:MAG: SDR family oxidoreductase, partial [Myxococcales bacterium]|nr:SDR family oxidoreductase [Myxococcales bacterium]